MPSLSSTVTFVSSSVLFLYDVGRLCLFCGCFSLGCLKLYGSERREDMVVSNLEDLWVLKHGKLLIKTDLRNDILFVCYQLPGVELLLC